MKKQLITFLGLVCFSLPLCAQSDEKIPEDVMLTISDLQQRWAVANYELQGKAQVKAFEQLITDVEDATKTRANQASILVWSGIIKSTFAGVKGGLGALKYAKAAKADLDRAISIDASVLQGSAYTSLGTLYYQVPGWPIGFGDDGKAKKLLEKAVIINPNGIDSNYFYAQYLLDEKHYTKAEKYLLKAQKATPRPHRPLADKGRQAEITVLLEKARKK